MEFCAYCQTVWDKTVHCEGERIIVGIVGQHAWRVLRVGLSELFWK